MQRIVFSFFLLLLTVSFAWAQNLVTVNGHLSSTYFAASTAGYPIAIELWDTSGINRLGLWSISSDINGDYSFSYPSAGMPSRCKGRVIVRGCDGILVYLGFEVYQAGTVLNNMDISFCPHINSHNAGFLAQNVPGQPNDILFFNMSFLEYEQQAGEFWDFGDGNTSTTSQTPHTYAAAGTYYACLTVQMQNGGSYNFCDSVTVGGAPDTPSVALTWGPMAPRGNGFRVTQNSRRKPVWFSYYLQGNIVYQSLWDTMKYDFASAGVDSASVYVIFSDGTSAGDDIIVTHGGHDFEAKYTPMQDTTQQYSLLLVEQSQGNFTNYFWDFGDGDTAIVQYPQHTYAGAGTYKICLEVYDLPVTCRAAYCDSIVVVNKTNAPFTIQVVLGLTTGTTPPIDAMYHVTFSPNPAQDQITISMDLPQSTDVAVQICDLQGKLVLANAAARYQAGMQAEVFDLRALPSGMYNARVIVGNAVQNHKIVVTH